MTLVGNEIEFFTLLQHYAVTYPDIKDLYFPCDKTYINRVGANIGSEKGSQLLFGNAFTCCDSMSMSISIGKKTV